MQPMVVVGRSSHVQKEVNEQACRDLRIPILRRSSGGATIVTGPGCLMYALVLSFQTRPDLKDIGRAHRFILGRLVTSLGSLLAGSGTVACKGTSDLVLFDRNSAEVPRKFSGNSLRVKRTHLLYHGTLLYDFDLTFIESCLRMPPRQPDYRGARAHRDFVMNLPVRQKQLEEALHTAWPSDGEMSYLPTREFSS